MNTEIRLPGVESFSCEPSAFAGDPEVSITVSIDSSNERYFGHGLRLIAERYDPQEYDRELAQARAEIQKVEALRTAIKAVIDYRDTGGTMLDTAIINLRVICAEVDLWTRSATTMRG